MRGSVGHVIIIIAFTLLLGCAQEKPAAAPKTAAAPAASQPSSGPASASSLPADHSTSSAAVGLGELFKMPEVSDDVVLTVGEHKVLKPELEEVLRTLQIQISAAGATKDLSRYEVLKTAVGRLAEMARRRLLAEEFKVKLDEAQVKLWIADIEARMKNSPSFRAFLLRAGKDEATRRKDAEQTVLWRQVQDEVLKRVMKDSESLAREYYDKNKNQFVEREGVEAWRIFMKAPRGMIQRDRDIIKDRAETAFAAAKKNPERFEDLARTYSDGGKGPHGGFIGWVPKGALPKVLEKAVFSAKPGTILPLHEAPVGYYIYKVGRHRKEETKSFDSVKEDIFRRAFPARVAKKVEEHMKRLKDRYPAKPAIPELAQLEQAQQARSDAAKARMQKNLPPK